MTPHEYADVIRGTFPQLTTWSDRAREGFEPSQGTSLTEDEDVYSYLSTSQVAWQALCAALDHLKGFRLWLVANQAPDPDDRPGMFPIATFSVLRGALVGGAIASWVLTSDDVEIRTGRSLCVAADWYRHHLKWVETTQPEALDAGSDISAIMVALSHHDRIETLHKRAEEVADLRQNRKPRGRLNTTNVIEEANAEIWPGEQARATQTMGLWQAGSGDAHALGWSILTRGFSMTPVDDGMGTFVSAPSIADIAKAYLCAYDFVAYGFRRLDELGT